MTTTTSESKMGNPGNGYCKPYRPYPRPESPMTVREAVEKHGDDWRLFIGDKSPFKKGHAETVTQDAREAIQMTFFERGIASRVRTDYLDAL